RAGDRPARQLVEPGALRQADLAPVGPEDRSGAPAGELPRLEDVPPDLLVRAHLGRGHGRRAALGRQALPDPPARALRALRRPLHGVPLLRGDAPGRPVQALRRGAAQLLGLARRVRRLGRGVRLDTVPPAAAARSRARASTAAPEGPRNGCPQEPKPMRRLLLLILVCALAAGCGGGKSASDTFALDQTAACAKVQQRLAAIKRPPVTAQASNAVRKRESKALQRYAIKVDRTLLAGVSDLRSVSAPPELETLQKRWLTA